MGSFAVSCGVSNLPIKYSDQVVFIPLLKNNNVSNSSFLHDTNAIYKPYLLPIKGVYSDYGYLENIEKDLNVELIEKHYKINIDSFIKLINEQGNIFYQYSEFNKSFNIKEIFLENSIESFLNNGFILESKNDIEYLYNELLDIKIQNINKSNQFNIDTNNYQIICHNSNMNFKFFNNSFFENLNKFLYNNFNTLLGLENQNDVMLIKELEQMSGMFVRREIYDNLSQVFYNDYPSGVFPKEEQNKTLYLSKLHLESLGFIEDKEKEIDIDNMSEDEFNDLLFTTKEKDCLFRKDNIVIKYGDYGSVIIEPKKLSTCYNVNDFIKQLNRLNYNVDISELSHITKMSIKENKIINEINRYYDNKLDKAFVRAIFNVLNSIDNRLFTNLVENYKIYTNFMKDEIIEQVNNKDKILLNKELLSSLDDFQYFINSMCAGNILLKPSFCAYQEGSLDMNKYLNKLISTEIKNINKSRNDNYNDLYK